jgi:transposase
MGRRPFVPLGLDDAERAELASLASRRSTAQALALRARIVLACVDGEQSKVVAARLGIARATVGKWRRRFAEHRLEGLGDEPRSGTPRTIDDERIEAVIVRTLESTPPDATHWSSRGMARASGLSVSTVQRIWRAFGLRPHRLETFKLSTDPDFVAKVRDVVGLYVAPPEHAIVLCVDEKSQIQALDRSQPMLPMRPGQPARRSHDYKRHGVTSLFAALDIATGQVIGKCFPRHRAAEFRKFLDRIEANVPKNLDIHLVMDNYATHKTQLIRDWLAKRPRWRVHLTPTSSSWLNQVERFFALLTDRKIRRGVHHSVADLQADIASFINQHNADPKPFRWTKSADDILTSIERFCVYNTPAAQS